jgi:hypothetical protein
VDRSPIRRLGGCINGFDRLDLALRQTIGRIAALALKSRGIERAMTRIANESVSHTIGFIASREPCFGQDIQFRGRQYAIRRGEHRLVGQRTSHVTERAKTWITGNDAVEVLSAETIVVPVGVCVWIALTVQGSVLAVLTQGARIETQTRRRALIANRIAIPDAVRR